MISIINKNIITPLYYAWNKDKRLKHLREAEEIQWLSTDEIRSRQLAKFIRIFKYAYQYTTFYNKLYNDFGVEIGDIKTFEDIKKLPAISKNDLQLHYKEMISTECSKENRYQDASGGSTGKPTIFYGDKRALPYKFASMMMYDKWCGWDIGEKSAYLWGADREVNRVKVFKEKIVQKLVYRTRTLNAFDLSEKDIHRFAEILHKEKPNMIVAYTNAAKRFAKYLLENSDLKIRPKGVICSAETLTEEDRKIIEEAFGCKVLNRYGSREVGLIAAECKAQVGLHINENDILLEYLNMNSTISGEQYYEIVVTDFNNYAMPFVKYNMGDIGIPTKDTCSCGRGMSLLKSVEGRTSDFIKHSSGRIIHGEYFSHIFYGINGILQFQVVQEEISSLNIFIVTSEELKEKDRTHINQKVYEIMGDDINIKINRVDKIETPPSGKFRFVISKLV